MATILGRPVLLIVLGFTGVTSAVFSLHGALQQRTIERFASFPSMDATADSAFLNGAAYFEFGGTEDIYISNTKEGNILVFNKAGALKKVIGRKGRGPAELYQPGKVMRYHDGIFVHDVGNQRIQAFDDEGRPSRYIKLFKAYRDMVFDEDASRFFAAPMTVAPGEKLVDVLALDGTIASSFGEPLDFAKDRQIYNLVRLCMTDNRELVVAFTFFPILRQYAPTGILVSEYRIDYPRFRANEKYNQASYHASLSDNSRMGLRSVIDGIRQQGGKFFVMNSYPSLLILELSSSLTPEREYVGSRQEEFFTQDFLVSLEGLRPVFFVLQLRPENEVDVYGIR
jgi:hypothetical protein